MPQIGPNFVIWVPILGEIFTPQHFKRSMKSESGRIFSQNKQKMLPDLTRSKRVLLAKLRFWVLVLTITWVAHFSENFWADFGFLFWPSSSAKSDDDEKWKSSKFSHAKFATVSRISVYHAWAIHSLKIRIYSNFIFFVPFTILSIFIGCIWSPVTGFWRYVRRATLTGIAKTSKVNPTQTSRKKRRRTHPALLFTWHKIIFFRLNTFVNFVHSSIWTFQEWQKILDFKVWQLWLKYAFLFSPIVQKVHEKIEVGQK